MPEVIGSTAHFKGKIVSVRVDEVRLEDGHVTRQEVVEHRESMTVVAMDAEQRLVLVRQYRHAVGEELLETPAGSVDPGETAEESVNRELAEETGWCAREVISLGSLYLVPGWATERMHFYAARGLYASQAEPDEDERIEIVYLPVTEWEARIAAGEIKDAKSIAAWHLARPHLLGE
jgi:ADP-ribose pyrophosphatase